MHTIRSVLPLVWVTLVATTASAADWETVSTNDGIHVQSRLKEGSEVREVMAVGIVDAPPERVFRVIGDLDHYKDFMPYTKESKVLSKEGKVTFFYTSIAPPLVANRDYTLRMLDESTGAVFKVSWEPANKKGPPLKKNTVRLEVNSGYWLVEPSEKGKSRATYYLYTDPAGDLPKWMVNKANRESVPDVFKAMRKRVTDPRYL